MDVVGKAFVYCLFCYFCSDVMLMFLAKCTDRQTHRRFISRLSQSLEPKCVEASLLHGIKTKGNLYEFISNNYDFFTCNYEFISQSEYRYINSQFRVYHNSDFFLSNSTKKSEYVYKLTVYLFFSQCYGKSQSMYINSSFQLFSRSSTKKSQNIVL